MLQAERARAPGQCECRGRYRVATASSRAGPPGLGRAPTRIPTCSSQASGASAVLDLTSDSIRRLVILLVATLLSGALPAAAQQSLAPGMRVRVARPARSVLTGSVTRVTPDSFWLQLPDRPQLVPIGNTEPSLLERSLGRRSYA